MNRCCLHGIALLSDYACNISQIYACFFVSSGKPYKYCLVNMQNSTFLHYEKCYFDIANGLWNCEGFNIGPIYLFTLTHTFVRSESVSWWALTCVTPQYILTSANTQFWIFKLLTLVYIVARPKQNTCNSPMEVEYKSEIYLLSGFKTNPGLQEHLNDPQVFTQFCSHSLSFWEHSSTSSQVSPLVTYPSLQTHWYEPMVLTQSAWTEHICNSFKNYIVWFKGNVRVHLSLAINGT